MRSSFGPEEFLLKSKKSHIQALVALTETMSLEDIEKLEEKPDIKRGLRNLVIRRDQKKSASIADILADRMIIKHHPELAKQLGLL